MGLRLKQTIMRQKASVANGLQDRLAFLSGKGIESPKADKDTIVRKLKADIKAANNRLRLIAENEKRTEENAKRKAERAAAPRKWQEDSKAEKPKKAAEEGKGKKVKAEKKAAPSKAPEGGKAPKTAESPEEGKAKKEKKSPEKGEEPAGK